jgi:hypothetical protein
MDIPLEIVNQGKEAIEKYVELRNKKDEVSEVNYKSYRKMQDQITKIEKAIKEYCKDYTFSGRPYFSDKDEEWKIPDIEKMSKLTDAIWTYQKNMETALSDYASSCYDFIKVSEKLEELE